MRVLVTGAAGYIGSHSCVELAQAGHEVVGIDNFNNSYPAAVERMNEVAGTEIVVHEVDLTDRAATRAVFEQAQPEAVVHFAALKAVGESVEQPLEYQRVNIGSTVSIGEAMNAVGCKKMIFSSSCTVYGEPQWTPVGEDHPLSVINPYGRTKLQIENLLRDAEVAYGWNSICLRYFNPVGAHPSGRMGEAAKGTPVNLMPLVLAAANGTRPPVKVFGDDYDTRDGSAIRDYLHVVDLARGHVAAVEAAGEDAGWDTVNLGTGTGSTVFEVINTTAEVLGTEVPHEVVGRRPGDAAAVYADASKAAETLGWRAERTLRNMIADQQAWEQAIVADADFGR